MTKPIQFNDFATLHNNRDVIFCKTDYIPALFAALREHEKEITLITGNSDYGITEQIVKESPDNIKRWYAQNVECIHPKITALPLGIENHEMCVLEGHGHGWPHAVEKIDTLSKFEGMPISPKNSIYANFSVGTHQSRQHVANIALKESTITAKIHQNHEQMRNLSYFDYVSDIMEHKMVICPRGNGVDCHRVWEVLYLGRVPVVERSIAMSFFEELPILFVDDWSELHNNDLMHEKYNNIKDNNTRMLDFNWWSDRITHV